MLEALAHYKILGWIGIGRMGELYRARDTRAGRTVALRVVADEIAGDPERRQQFLIDARAAAALSHPNIAALYDIGEDQARLFFVSEFVPGDTLRTLISGRPLNLRHALEHGIQLADALADGHAVGLLHHDIQPHNIIITPKGIAKFVDFGLGAWTASGAERQRITSVAGDNAGSADAVVSYMAPEQVLGRPVDERSDVFSLGVVLFEMLAGTPPPLVPPAPNALTAEVLQMPPPPPSALNPTLPRELDAIVLKMLARSIDDRYGSAATVAAELRSVATLLDVREGAPEPSPIAVAASPRRGLGMWILIVLAAIGVIAALAYYEW